MKSIQGKFTLFTVLAIIISVVATGFISIYFVRGDAIRNTESLLALNCENRQQSLNSFLNSIEQSVTTISNYAEDDLDQIGGVSEEQLQEHLDNIAPLFHSISDNTNGVLTYYYRIDPELTEGDVGFWYTREDGEGGEFEQTKLTHIEDYDRDDISHVGWFTVPKEAGAPVWMDPYMNENLGVEMISYVAPIEWNGTFVGVIGIDLSYATLIQQMEDIMAFETGYAFLVNSKDGIVYHPALETGTPVTEISSSLSSDSLSKQNNNFVGFETNGVKQHCAWRTMSNGMKLFVAAPDAEMNNDWENLIYLILISTLVILILFAIATAVFVRRITTPLRHLTDAARRIDRGDYDVELTYKSEDEVGVLTSAFWQLVNHLNAYEGDPNDLFQKDPLTSVRNKTAFDLYAGKMNDRINTQGQKPAFAVCVFQCDNVREVNEKYGHDNGDITLKTACMLICEVFKHSSVFRIGGEQFAAVLQQDDYDNREDLWKAFEVGQQKVNETASDPWKKADISGGMVAFDPNTDSTVEDVLRRAEEIRQGEKKE